jgi:hypothetical protein
MRDLIVFLFHSGTGFASSSQFKPVGQQEQQDNSNAFVS